MTFKPLSRRAFLGGGSSLGLTAYAPIFAPEARGFAGGFINPNDMRTPINNTPSRKQFDCAS